MRWSQRCAVYLDEPVDGASLAFFRVAFGVALVVLAARFFTHHWIEADYRAAHVFIPYWGFGWVKPWPGVGMYVHYAVMLLAAGCVAVGIFYRAAAVVFALTFAYAHLCDESNFLNHYYFVGLVSLLLILAPLDREGSLRVLLYPDDRRPRVRRWVLFVLRFQTAVVYTFGGLAKLGSDWLLRGEPLRIWLAANVELPLLGRFFRYPATAIVFSWGGCLFDLTIVWFLLWRRTRWPAYGVLLVFHGLTALLFRIGMFPWLMSIAATLFFDPAWPRVVWARFAKAMGRRPRGPLEGTGRVAGGKVHRGGLLALGGYVAVQVLLPLRHFVYPGNTLWTEEGFRYAWRVMLIEKSGDLKLEVVDAAGHRTLVEPRQYLTPFQARMTATQPDMILKFAHLVAADFDARGVGPVRVYADSRVSFNGRPNVPMIDPTFDLAHAPDQLAPQPFILPAPTSTPQF